MRHPAPRRIRPDRPVADVDGQLHHLVAQGGEHDRRQAAHRLGGGPHRADVLTHVAQRLAGLHAEATDDRAVGDADTEPEPPLGHLVQIARRGGERDRVLEVDRLDRRAELDGARGVCDRQAQPHRVAEARAVDPGEPPSVDLRRQLDRLGPPSGNVAPSSHLPMRPRACPGPVRRGQRQGGTRSALSCPVRCSRCTSRQCSVGDAVRAGSARMSLFQSRRLRGISLATPLRGVETPLQLRKTTADREPAPRVRRRDGCGHPPCPRRST